MAFVCPEKSQKRKNLLKDLKCMLDNMGGGDSGCCPPSCCQPPSVNSCLGPVIEIYDPLPKPCLPICSPTCGPCPPPGCCPSPGCCPPQCTPGTCPPPNASVPICPPPPQPICVPPILPVCTPVPPPCVPICNPNPEEQPCVPCNPPQMMVCYRRPQSKTDRDPRSKSRELRASILHIGCHCEKHNGLQDDCPRSECQGSPECLTQPDPTCPPSQFSNGKHLGLKNSGKGQNLEQYQCYPAFVRLPSCAPCGGSGNGGCPPPSCGPCGPCPPPCGPCGPCLPPCVPLIAQAPCPPPVMPTPPPCVPVGRVVPVCPAVPVPIPCPPPLTCCPPTNQPQCCPCPPPSCYPCPPPPCCPCPWWLTDDQCKCPTGKCKFTLPRCRCWCTNGLDCDENRLQRLGKRLETKKEWRNNMGDFFCRSCICQPQFNTVQEECQPDDGELEVETCEQTEPYTNDMCQQLRPSDDKYPKPCGFTLYCEECTSNPCFCN